MSDTLIGAIVGGTIAVVGGFAGAWLIRWRDDVRASNERRAKRLGAINILLSELVENYTNLELRTATPQLTRMEVRDQAFNQLQEFIARELEPETWAALYTAYGRLRSPNYLYSVFSPAGELERYKVREEAATDVLVHIKAAREALLKERGPWPQPK